MYHQEFYIFNLNDQRREKKYAKLDQVGLDNSLSN